MEAASRHTVRPHYSRLLEAAGLGLMITDIRGLVMFVSPMAAKLLQRPIETLYGQHFETLFNQAPPILSDGQEVHQRLHHRKKTFDLTFIRFNAQIEITFSLVNSAPIAIPQTDYPDDPDDLRSLLVESQWRETLYSVLAHHLPNLGVLMFDTDYRYLLAEGEALERSGFNRAMMEGHTIDEVLSPELVAELKPLYRAALDGQSIETEYNYADFNYYLTTIPIWNNDGVVIAGMIVIHDVTQFRRIETELRASKDHLTTLVKAMPDVIFMIDRHERIVDFHSDEYNELVQMLFPTLGVNTTLRESGLPEIFYEKFLQGMREAFEKQKRKIFTLETILQNSDNIFSVEVTISPLQTESALVIIRDMSEQAWMQDLLSRMMARMIALDRIENEITDESHNPQALQAMALRSAEMSVEAEGFIAMLEDHQTWGLAVVHQSAYHPQSVTDYLNQWPPIIQEVVTTGQEHTLTREEVIQTPPFLGGMGSQAFIPLKIKDKVVGILVLEATMPGTLDRDALGFIELSMSRFTSALENLRLRVKAERQLEELSELYERVSKLEQLKTDMIRVASHDLRTPMMLIVNYVNLAREGLAKSALAEVHEYLDAIRAATERMRQMTGEILSLERLQSLMNDEQPNIEEVTELVHVAFEDHAQSAQLKSQAYTLSVIDEKLLAAIDPVQIREAIGNLISNAIKYTPNGGTISVSLRTEGAQIVFSVTDTGYGIPKEAFDKLFQPFYRVPQTRRIAEGTGLGLSLVKSIIERHKGRLFVESEQGKGSTFGFTLPRYTPSA